MSLTNFSRSSKSEQDPHLDQLASSFTFLTLQQTLTALTTFYHPFTTKQDKKDDSLLLLRILSEEERQVRSRHVAPMLFLYDFLLFVLRGP